MLSYAPFEMEEEEDVIIRPRITKKPTIINNRTSESECTYLIIFFIFGMIILSA